MAARTTLHHYFAAGTGRRPPPAAGSGAACRTSSASGREEAAPPPPPRPAGRRRGREKGGRGWRGIRRPPPPPPLAPLFATPRGAGSASSAGTLGPGPARSRSGTLVTPSPVPGRGRNRRKRARAGSAPSEGRAGDGGSGGGGGGGGGGTKRQMYLDLGQATFASRTVCPTCGMLYVHGLAEDAAAHERVCSEHRVGVPFRGWKGERVVARWEGGKGQGQGQASGEEGGGRIVEVRPDDPARHRALVRRVKAIVDGEMGFADGGGGTGDEGDDAGGASSSSSSSLFGRTAYLCVAGGTVVGLCTVEVLATAHRLLGEEEEEEEGPVPVPAVPNLRRSLLPTRAGMGIHQLWCHPTHRKGESPPGWSTRPGPGWCTG